MSDDTIIYDMNNELTNIEEEVCFLRENLKELASSLNVIKLAQCKYHNECKSYPYRCISCKHRPDNQPDHYEPDDVSVSFKKDILPKED